MSTKAFAYLSTAFWAVAAQYIGTKELQAVPMTLGEYNMLRGWDIPDDEDGSDGGYIVRYQDGHVSWSPEQTFDMAYSQSGRHSFGDAVHFLKDGHKVARAGWNGKGMWLVLVHGSKTQITLRDGSTYRNAGLTEVKIDSHIDMHTAGGTMQPGWLASQADMLADDWEVVE